MLLGTLGGTVCGLATLGGTVEVLVCMTGSNGSGPCGLVLCVISGGRITLVGIAGSVICGGADGVVQELKMLRSCLSACR